MDRDIPPLQDLNGGDNDLIDLSYYPYKTNVYLQENKREIQFMAADGTLAKKVMIGAGEFERVKHGALGGDTFR